MVIDDAVKTAAQLAVPVTRGDIAIAMRSLSALGRKLLTAEVRQSLLLPIEKPVHAALEQHIRTLKKDVEVAKARCVALVKYRGYKRLSLEPLSWRNNQLGPRLIPFRLDSPTFSFYTDVSFRGYGDSDPRFEIGSRPAIPELLLQCYADVLQLTERHARSHKKSTSITAEFAGVIPANTKERIAHAQTLFSDVFILAEVKEWKREEKAPTREDPLVVGFENGMLWLIDAFDTTPTEEYVKREFTIDP